MLGALDLMDWNLWAPCNFSSSTALLEPTLYTSVKRGTESKEYCTYCTTLRTQGRASVGAGTWIAQLKVQPTNHLATAHPINKQQSIHVHIT